MGPAMAYIQQFYTEISIILMLASAHLSWEEKIDEREVGND